MAPLFSIIIPTYNRALLLRRALLSVTTQTFGDWELIVVDDGSTDNTELIVGGFMRDNRVRYFKQKNQGVSTARNAGSSLAVGKYLVFLDSDDELKEGYLGEAKEAASADPDILFVGVDVVRENGVVRNVPARKPYGTDSDMGLYLAGSFIIRKELFQKAGGYDPLVAYGENTELSFRLSDPMLRKGFIDKYLLRINHSTSSRSSSLPAILARSSVYVLNKHRAFFDKDKRVKRLFLQIAGVSSLRMQDFSQARKYLLKAYLINPFRLKSLLRLVVALVPFISKQVYPGNVVALNKVSNEATP